MPIKYTPPTTKAIAALKGRLNKSNTEMADLFGMSPEHWRKYTGGHTPRELSPHMLFFAMARLTLKQKDIESVLDAMREAGAEIDLSSSFEEDLPSD